MLRWTPDGPAVVPPALTAEQAAAADALEPNATLRAAVRAALAANRNFLALPAPGPAQTLEQVRALTRQMNALARLALADLDGTD